MNNIFETDKKFKEIIGAFMITFSKLEYGLSFIGVLTEFDLRKREENLPTHIGNSLENKIRNITNYIENNNLIELKEIWDIKKNKIGQLNRERRFIAHGFASYSLPRENITTHIKENKKLVKRKFKIETLKRLKNELNELNTGKNGISGEFYIEFSRQRINQWNNLVNEENKIIYKVNSEVLSDWKGK